MDYLIYKVNVSRVTKKLRIELSLLAHFTDANTSYTIVKLL